MKAVKLYRISVNVLRAVKPSWLLGFALPVLFSLVACGVKPVFAQDQSPTDDEVNAIARGLYCPVCENVPLDVCPTQACAEWRDLIRQKLTAGWTPAQIEAYFADQYGDRVLSVPPPRGFNLLVYIVPPTVVLLGLSALLRGYSTWKKRALISPLTSAVMDPTTTATGSVSPDDPYVRRLEEELKKRS